MIEFLSASSETSHEAVGFLAAGGGIASGWIIKYLIDKLANNRNGINGKAVTLAEIKTRQETCIGNQNQTLNILEKIEDNTREQAIYSKIMCETMKEMKP